MGDQDGTSRAYASPKRQAKAAETRERLVEAALALLRQEAGGAPSLEAVANAAGVTRLTVYNQFGSRRGLLEAAFDALAARGGMGELAAAMASPAPREGLAKLVQVFCRFWGSDGAFAGFHAAATADPEFAESLAARNARRGQALSVLAARHGGRDAAAQRDVVDVLLALTSFATFQSLAAGGRSPDAVCALLAPLCDQAMVGPEHR